MTRFGISASALALAFGCPAAAQQDKAIVLDRSGMAAARRAQQDRAQQHLMPGQV